MTSMQYNIIGALAIAAAASILLFDTVGRTRKPAASLVAWLVFCQMGCLAVAAFIRADAAVQWLLIGGLAVHAINIVLAVVAPFLISQCYNLDTLRDTIRQVVAPFLISQCYNLFAGGQQRRGECQRFVYAVSELLRRRARLRSHQALYR